MRLIKPEWVNHDGKYLALFARKICANMTTDADKVLLIAGNSMDWRQNARDMFAYWYCDLYVLSTSQGIRYFQLIYIRMAPNSQRVVKVT